MQWDGVGDRDKHIGWLLQGEKGLKKKKKKVDKKRA